MAPRLLGGTHRASLKLQKIRHHTLQSLGALRGIGNRNPGEYITRYACECCWPPAGSHNSLGAGGQEDGSHTVCSSWLFALQWDLVVPCCCLCVHSHCSRELGGLRLSAVHTTTGSSPCARREQEQPVLTRSTYCSRLGAPFRCRPPSQARQSQTRRCPLLDWGLRPTVAPGRLLADTVGLLQRC
jgi:hypothetical protein